MATSTSSFHSLDDGLQVYQRIWTPETTPKAHMILLHGFSDRVDHYDAFFSLLLKSYPIRVIGWDRRGWGKTVQTKAQRGNTGDLPKQLVELNSLINHITTTIPSLTTTPLFLMGHSMGGQLAAAYMLSTMTLESDARPKISGFVLESPWIGLDPATQPSSFIVAAGRLACMVVPHLQKSNPLPAEYICPDVAVQEMYADDPLCHGLGTLECFRDALAISADFVSLSKDPQSPPATLKAKLPCPVLWTHGTADKACDFPSSKALCMALESCSKGNKTEREDDKVWLEYDGWAHQLHNQPSPAKEQYAKDVGEWVLAIAGRE